MKETIKVLVIKHLVKFIIQSKKSLYNVKTKGGKFILRNSISCLDKRAHYNHPQNHLTFFSISINNLLLRLEFYFNWFCWILNFHLLIPLPTCIHHHSTQP